MAVQIESKQEPLKFLALQLAAVNIIIVLLFKLF